LAVLVALVYGAMTGSKGNAVVLLLTLVFVSAIRAKRFPLIPAIGLTFTALALFAFGTLLVNFAYTEFAGFDELVTALVGIIQGYWLGGVLAFGEVAVQPNAFVSTQPIHRFFLETARSLGADVDVPPKHAEFTAISADVETNIYTAYFSYFKDYGWLGTVAIMLALGAAMTALYRAAMKGRPIAGLVFARLAVALVFTLNADHFFMGLNGLTKFVVFLFAVYRILPALAGRPRA
jgi:oligosaccharide repeat unit polymerase